MFKTDEHMAYLRSIRVRRTTDMIYPADQALLKAGSFEISHCAICTAFSAAPFFI